MAEQPMTRAAAMALADEEQLIRQGYEFLDEKRMLLATEIMKQLKAWSRLRVAHDAALQKAKTALSRALLQHGLEELQVYPPPVESLESPRGRRKGFLGVTLIELHIEDADEAGTAGSDVASTCAAAFGAVLPVAAQLAAVSGNLLRLADEYRRTERRARALENVLLPEISSILRTIEERLESVDQEEAVRVRQAKR